MTSHSRATKPDHAFGYVGVEVVADHVPRRRGRRRGEQTSMNPTEIRLGTAVPDRATQPCRRQHRTPQSGLSCHAGYTRTHAARRVPVSSAGSGRLAPAPGCRSSRRSKRSAALLGGGAGCLVHRADVGTLRVEIRIRLGRQPVTVAMRLEVGLFFKKRPTEPCEMLFTMPRADRLPAPVRSGSND